MNNLVFVHRCIRINFSIAKDAYKMNNLNYKVTVLMLLKENISTPHSFETKI